MKTRIGPVDDLLEREADRRRRGHLEPPVGWAGRADRRCPAQVRGM